MNKQIDIKTLTGLSVLTAIVIILQGFVHIKFGIFSISTVLVPIVIGGALYGMWAGAWLGLVFGVTVLLSGDAAFFFALDTPMAVPGTIIIVICKGIGCGVASAFVYGLLKKRNLTLASVVSGLAAPIINTGLFIVGCRIFLYSSVIYIITAFIGINFVIELIVNIILNPVIMRVIHFAKTRH